MRIEGTIYPAGVGSDFSRDAWCKLVASRPEFCRLPPRQARNPFTGDTMTVHPPPDAAEVVLEGRPVGSVFWSMSEDQPLVNVSIETFALPLVREWAAALGGTFRRDPSA
jgi:hypothetical protein